jgi:hypothetical protein
MSQLSSSRRGLYRNVVSYFGGLVMVGSAILIVATTVGMALAPPSPYLGIVAYLLLPGVLFAGLLVLLYGMRRESVRRRRLKIDDAPPYPRLDLNDPRQRRRFGYVIIIGSLLIIVVGFAGFKGFEFTESVTFCGRLCHRVMEPEYVTYLDSPHARVKCVECHVGSGTSWYVKSKLSGVRQVFATVRRTYARPISVPIKNLRPARETCEQCHWPEHFFGARLMQSAHFRFDEKNTAEQITLALKTGGGSERLGGRAGIHWYMIINNQIRYAATDREQQRIPIVRVRRSDGSETEYLSLDEKGPKAPSFRLLDCMDCHNRPTHILRTPEAAIDQALASGLISRKLPFVKKVALGALEASYADQQQARVGIRQAVVSFYSDRRPQVLRDHAADLERVVAVLVSIRERSVFPYMKVEPRTYANNIGHRSYPGCFRCHDNRHVAKDGRRLSRDCTLCHSMPERGPLQPVGMPASQPVSWHPLELEGKHADLACNRCHRPGPRPASGCATCHSISTKAPMMESMGCGDCHLKAGQAKPVASCGSCHEDIAGLHRRKAHQAASCTVCHRQHVWKVSPREACLKCHRGQADHVRADGACDGCYLFSRAKKSGDGEK